MAEATLDRLLDDAAGPPGSTRRASSARRGEPLGSRLRWAAPWLAMLVVAGAIAPWRDRWLVQAVLLVWLAAAPGRLLLTALRVRPLQVRRVPVYTVAMSLLVLMLTGLAVDGVGLASGDSAPLRTGPLWVGTVIVYLALVGAAASAPAHVRPSLARPPGVSAYWVLALPVLAAVGAARLNAGNGSTVALVAMITLVTVWLARPFLPRFTWRAASITVYAVSLAGTWSFSLRGDSVYGFDIITEYLIARQTDVDGAWHAVHHNDAYGALLSITVLPTYLHGVAGLAVLAFFKAVVPAILAFVPVGVLRIAGRLLRVRWAYAATGLFIGQVFFMAGIPAVSRQAVAFVFVVALVAALLERRQPLGTVLACLFAVGVVLSHYSSSYMAVAVLLVAVVLVAVGRLLRRRPPAPVALLVTLLVLAAGSTAWYDGLTRSASNARDVADSFRSNGLDLLPNRAGGVLSTIIKGNVGQPLTAAQYETSVATLYRQIYPFVHLNPNAADYPLQEAPAGPAGGVLATVSAPLVSAIGQLINLLGLVGSLVLVFARRWRGHRAHRVAGLLGVGSAAFLALVRVSGTAAQVYNLERAQLQGFVVLASIAVWSFWRAARVVGSRLGGRRPAVARWVPRVAVGLVGVGSTVLVANAVGLTTDHPTDRGRANLSAGGQEAARFVERGPDLVAGRWLAAANPSLRQITYADTYGRFRILLAAGAYKGVFTDVTPRTLARRSWIFEYSANGGPQGAAQSAYNGRPASYEFPSEFVRRDYDRVYSNGPAAVYFG